MNCKHVIIILVASIFLFTSISFAEIAVTTPSASNFPDAGSLNGDVNYQGNFNYSINLMDVPGRNGMSLPININYESGIAVDEDATWVGLGWDLSTGYVTRSVINIPDEQGDVGRPGVDSYGFFRSGWEDVLIEDMIYPDLPEIFDCHDIYYLVLPGSDGRRVGNR